MRTLGIGSISSTWGPAEKQAMGTSLGNEGQGTLMGMGGGGNWEQHCEGREERRWEIVRPADGGHGGLAPCVQQRDGC